MKNLILLIFTLSFVINVNAQYSISIEGGFSDYVNTSENSENFPTSEEIQEGLIDFDILPAWRITLDKQFNKEKVIGMIGVTLFDVGAENFFYEKWRNTFIGVHLGAEYKINKFSVGLHTHPAVRLGTSVQVASLGGGLSGGQKAVYNIDITPSVSYNPTNNFSVFLRFSHGLNNPLKVGEDGRQYRVNAFYIGAGYTFFK